MATEHAAQDDVVGRIEGRDMRVHVNVGPVCNNNCIFCMEEDRDMRAVVNGAMTPERVRQVLVANRGAQEVCFTSGEPTLVRELPQYARWARQLGYRRVSVMTNGRRLAHQPVLDQLIRAGINFFYVSIHGHTAKLHNSLVREPTAFDQTVQGIRNIAAARHHGLTLHTSTVLSKRNLPHLVTIYRFLRELGVDQVVFNVMQANGRANTYFDQLFPRYAEIADAFRGFIRDVDEEQPQAFLVDIPLCVTEGIPDFNRGYVEAYTHYEVAGFEDRSPERLEVTGRARRTADEQFLAVTREDLDAVQRDKRAECTTCRYDGACEGVWRNYLRRHGWDEMTPR